ncbi:hypothetical protein [Rhodoplanes roseus]|uniref:Uncharacterized protein n=1 Tax=Rhodoplanes roseus TaxID=29409 RepID=A0A327L3W8_9BRAD|nr:hypothetical protein [Rhodoplanes roseus]RAI44695.1 hypothetical protein CH341_07715 [Rhodoplanes roseus]
MKVLYEKTINGQTMLMNVTTPAGNQGAYVLQLVKPGNKFFAWPSIPTGQVIGCDFTDAPVCAGTATANNDIINAGMPHTPEEVLVYA